MNPSVLPFVLFSYSIDHLAQKDKVMFYYALKGRDGKSGILKDKIIIQLGRAILLVPESKSRDVFEFLTHWKCQFVEKKILINKKYLC